MKMYTLESLAERLGESFKRDLDVRGLSNVVHKFNLYNSYDNDPSKAGGVGIDFYQELSFANVAATYVKAIDTKAKVHVVAESILPSEREDVKAAAELYRIPIYGTTQQEIDRLFKELLKPST